MVDFDIRRAELVECPTNDSRDWFLLNSKVCGVPLARFMATSPLVFPGEFRTVSLDGAQLDRGVYKDVVPTASSFGVVSAILPETRRRHEDAYSWLVDAINSLKIESRPETSESSDRKDETTPQTCADSITNSFSDITLRLQRMKTEVVAVCLSFSGIYNMIYQCFFSTFIDG